MARDSNTKTLLERSARDSLVYLPAMIIPAIVGIVMLRIFTMIFTREQFGYYNNGLSTTGLIKTFSVIWLSSSTLRFYQAFKRDNKEGEFFSSLLFAATISAAAFTLAAFAVLALFHFKLDFRLQRTLQAAILSTIFVAYFEIFVIIFRASLRPSKYSFYWILYVIGKPLIGLALVLTFHIGPEGLFLGWCLAPLLLIFFVFKDIKIRQFLNHRFISWPVIRSMASYGVPLAISSFAIWILSLSDRYLIEIFRSSEEVGLYGLGFAIPEKTLQFAFMTLLLAAFPIIIENYENNSEASTIQLVTEMSRFYILLITPLLLLLAAMPAQILLLFADKNFAASSSVIPQIAVGLYLYGLSMYVQKGLELKKKSKRIAANAFIAGAVAIGSNVLLIPRLGYWGASISFMAAYLCYFILAIILVRNVMPWKPPMRSIGATVIASLAMLAAIKTAMLIFSAPIAQLLGGLVAGLGIYSVTLLLLKEVNKDDVSFLTSYVKRVVR